MTSESMPRQAAGPELVIRECELRPDGTAVAGRAEDLADGERWLVRAGVRTIGVFRVKGRFFAMLNRCPHQGAELCRGQLFPRVSSSEPGSYVYDYEHPVISCPWHAWEFDLATGASEFDPAKTRVKVYDVDVDGEPRAEIFPAEVDEGWLVIRLRDERTPEARTS